MEPNQAKADLTESVENTKARADVSSSTLTDGKGNETSNELSQSGEAPALDPQIAAASSTEDIRKIMEQLAAQPAPDGDAVVAKVSDKTKEGVDAAADKDDGEEDDAPLTLDKTATRYRLTFREDDEVGRMAAAIQKRNKDWTLEQSLAEARKRTGKEAQADNTADGAKAAATAEPEADDVASLDAKIAELRAAKKAAVANVEFERMAELDDQLDVLREQRADARAQGAKAGAKSAKAAESPATKSDQAQAAPDYDAAFDASAAKAAELYPFMNQPDSPAAKRMAAIEAALEANKDPLFDSPDKPLRVAQMVAAELAIAPKIAGSKPAAVAAVTAPARQVTRLLSPIASGASRTTTTRTQDASQMAEIGVLKSPADLERFLAKAAGART